MAKVVAIGGVFFKAKNLDELRSWYRDRLGIDLKPWGGAEFQYDRRDRPGKIGYTVWSPFAEDTKYFEPSDKPFMINMRVDNLDELLGELRAAGARVLERREDGENGKFGYVVDPDGTLIELWEQAENDPYV